MPVAQPLLPRSAPAGLRSVRRLHAGAGAWTVRLPHDVRDRLAVALIPYRKRDAAYDLATFLAGSSSPARGALVCSSSSVNCRVGPCVGQPNCLQLSRFRAHPLVDSAAL